MYVTSTNSIATHLSLSLSLYLPIYIYIYMYTHIHIYIYKERERDICVVLRTCMICFIKGVFTFMSSSVYLGIVFRDYLHTAGFNTECAELSQIGLLLFV